MKTYIDEELNPDGCNVYALYKKLSFLLRISSVNVTKSAVSCGFGQIYLRNPSWKTSFLYSDDPLKEDFQEPRTINEILDY